MPEEFDVVVVGAGPAGLAAAVTAAESGARVAILDERPYLGGQIWQKNRGNAPPAARHWIDRLHRTTVVRLHGTSVADIDGMTLYTNRGAIQGNRIILACGARERFLPFPGWTLPGVTGAGALQALSHDGFEVRGQRVVVAGSGPLLLQVADGLRSQGAQVVRIAEQASMWRLLRFSFALGADKLRQALTLWRANYRTSQWVASAHGEDALKAVTIRSRRGDEVVECDRLAVGFTLVPNLELAQRFGCATTSSGVVVDDQQATSTAGVYAAGEVCGIKGAPGALAEGLCAGAAACDTAPAAEATHSRNRERLFALHLASAFALRPELARLADDDTVVCRCEDVRYQELLSFDNWSSAKLQTRCGMGACQGRVCGTATQHLFGWGPQAVRPPLVPIPVGELMTGGNAL